MAWDTEKKEKDDESRFNSYDGRVFRLRLRKALLILIVVLIVAGAAIVLYMKQTGKEYTQMQTLSSVEWKPGGAFGILPYGSSFLSYSADGIHCTDANGTDIWSAPYLMQDPMIRVAGDYVAAADRKGRTIYVYDRTGARGEITTSNPVESIAVSATGVVVAVLEGVDVTPICLYYYDGSEIAVLRTTMAKSGYPVSISISDNSRLLSISYLRVETGSLVSSVAFYNFGEVGKNETDNLVGGNDYPGELVPLVGFLDEETAFAVSDRRLMIYEGAQRPANTANIMLQEDVRSVYHGSANIGLVYYDTTGTSRYRMDIYDKKGTIVSNLYFDLPYEDIFFHDDQVVIYNATSCMIYTIKGQLKYQGEYSEGVKLMIPTTSKYRYVLVMEDEIRTVELK